MENWNKSTKIVIAGRMKLLERILRKQTTELHTHRQGVKYVPSSESQKYNCLLNNRNI